MNNFNYYDLNTAETCVAPRKKFEVLPWHSWTVPKAFKYIFTNESADVCKLWRYAERSCGNCNDLLEPITTLKEEFAFAENRTSKLQRSVSHSLALLLVGTLLTGQVQLVYMLIYSRTFKAFSMLYEPILLQNSVMHFLFTLQCSYPSFFCPVL